MPMDFKIKKDGRPMQPQILAHTAEPEVVSLYYPRLAESGLVQHCFTTRMGGVSKGEYASMNLSFTRGDDENAVKENYKRVADAMGTAYDRIVCSDQTHTTNVRKVTSADAGCGLTKKRGYSDIDGLITNEPGLTLATFYADCVPLYFVDTVHRAIGLSHSGWRGTVRRMGRVTIEAMRKEYKTEPKDVLCAIGPSICKDCYEVSADVAEEFIREFPHDAPKILDKKANGKYQLDLWEANRRVLLDAGVPEENIVKPNVCTSCNHDLLFSHRASNGRRGNLGAFLCIREL